MQIDTSSRKLSVVASNKLGMMILLKNLHASLANSPYVKINRYNSFSPLRSKNFVNCFINGESYFRELLHDLDNAKFEVFIRGWWVSPELYLRRPIESYPETRLDKVLARAAARGVKIYMILYKELKGHMPNDSSHSKRVFEGISKNIKVLRHPSTKC